MLHSLPGDKLAEYTVKNETPVLSYLYLGCETKQGVSKNLRVKFARLRQN